MTEALRDALGQIAGKNDLSGVSDTDLASAACNALHECELIARAALAATPARPAPTNARYSTERLEMQLMDTYNVNGDQVFYQASKRLEEQRIALASATPAVGGGREALELIKRLVDNEIMTDEEILGDIRVEVYEALAALPASPLRGREDVAAVLYMKRFPHRTWLTASLTETDLSYQQADAVLALFSASPPAQPAAAPDVRAIDRRCDQIDRRMEKHQHIASDKKALDGETGA